MSDAALGSYTSDAMKQQTLTGFEKYAKKTRRAQFLADMEKIIKRPHRAKQRTRRPFE
jgi:hypothetical protein